MTTSALSARPAPIRFGAFDLDPATGELTGNGTRVTLAEQPLVVLLTLLERPGQLVSRDELRQRLWPTETFVDFEHGLNAAVRRLRDAIGDSADTPQYIETLPRRGYRFIAPVDRPPSRTRDTRPSNLPATGTPPAPRPTRRWSGVVLSLIVLVAGAGTAWFALAPRATPEAPASPVARGLTRVTFGQGLDTHVTWSPDGQRIAFASDRSGNFDIWIQSLLGGEATPVTTSPAADVEPAWAPDGATIAFRSEREGGGIYVVPALGGVARRLTTFGAHPMWMSDGRDLLVVALGGGATRAYLVPALGGDPPREVLAEFLRGGNWEWMAPHPDGRLSLLGRHRTRGFGFYTLRPDGQSMIVVSPSKAFVETLGNELHPRRRFFWSPQGAAVYVQATNSGIETVWRIAVAPRTLEWLSIERLTTGTDHADTPAISPDGVRLALSSQRRVSRAWVFPFDPASGRLEVPGRPITAEDVSLTWPSLSRDGQTLLYSAQRSGTNDVDAFETDLETGATRILARNALGAVPSPDRTRYVHLLQRRRGGPPSDPATAESAPAQAADDFELAVSLTDATGSEHLLTRWNNRQRVLPSDWTPDGKGIVGSYCLEDCASGPVVLAVWPVTAELRLGPARILVQGDGRRYWQGSYSPDGRALTFVAERADRPGRVEIGVMPVSGPSPGSWTRIAADHEWPDKPRWAPDGRTIYFLSRKPAGLFNVWGVRMDASTATQTGEPFQVTTFSSPALQIDPNLAASEMDIRGQRLLLMMASTKGNIWVLSNADR